MPVAGRGYEVKTGSWYLLMTFQPLTNTFVEILMFEVEKLHLSVLSSDQNTYAMGSKNSLEIVN